jgi:hypothetical protein
VTGRRTAASSAALQARREVLGELAGALAVLRNAPTDPADAAADVADAARLLLLGSALDPTAAGLIGRIRSPMADPLERRRLLRHLVGLLRLAAPEEHGWLLGTLDGGVAHPSRAVLAAGAAADWHPSDRPADPLPAMHGHGSGATYRIGTAADPRRYQVAVARRAPGR